MSHAKLLTIICVMILAPSAFAQATRTWVSGVGDDANPCSRTAPCKTFAGAISKTAAGGEINVLDPGGFGAVTITKAITIDGGGNLSGVLVSGTNGIVVNAGSADDIILRNLDIDGVGSGLSGISFLAGRRLMIENSKIYGFTRSGVSVAPAAGNVDILVSNVTVSQVIDSVGGTAAAINIAPGGTATVQATVANSVIKGNDRGVVVLGGGKALVQNSNISNSLYAGVAAIGGTRAATATVDGSAVTGNATGVRANGATVFLGRSTISNNFVMGLDPINGGQVVSFGNNQVMGNAVDGTISSNLPLR